MRPERVVQPMFSGFKLFSSLAVALPIIACWVWLKRQPDRWPGPDRVVAGEAVPAKVGKGMRAWRLTAADQRFGGLSALAVDGDALLAVSDSGVAIRFAPPVPGREMRFRLRDLPGGPGTPLHKWTRDSESLLGDGSGWWVGFESRHSLWRYDPGFHRVLETRWLHVNWRDNFGAEALIFGKRHEVIALPEGGGRAVGGDFVTPMWTSDATRLADGRVVLLNRRLTRRGFVNQVLIQAGAGKPARRIALHLKPLDNMEGIAAVPQPNGGTRLWIVSDDNFRPWMRTLLVALDLPPSA